VAFASPGPAELAELAEIDARSAGDRRGNPPKPLKVADRMLIPHFWVGGQTIQRHQSRKFYAANGFVIWEGPSPMDGAPIVLIATGFLEASDNAKTGRMIQTWILRSDMHPQEAVDTGQDSSICFDCKMRGEVRPATRSELRKDPQRPATRAGERSCYVTVTRRGPATIYKAYVDGKYPRVAPEDVADLFAFTFPVRIGSYGEPVTVPEAVWRKILKHQTRWTGYTHQWHDPQFQGFKDFCMASVDSPDQQVLAQTIYGWRTYRAAGPAQLPLEGSELVCPHYPEAGMETRWTCDTCGWCQGRGMVGKSVVAPVHGSGAAAFVRASADSKGFTTADGTFYPKGYFAAYYVPREALYATRERRRIAMRKAFPARLARALKPKKNPTNPGHDHPRVRFPRPRSEVYDQLRRLREEAGLPGRPALSWPSSLSRLHETSPRRYAQLYFPGGEIAGAGDPRYELAEQARWLPARNLRGVLAHEVGHELAGPHGSEAEADAAAEEALGLDITYDRRWPGKGLQRANPGLEAEFCVTYVGIDQSGRDLPEEILFCGSHNECFVFLHRAQSQSVDWALKHGGYSITQAPWIKRNPDASDRALDRAGPPSDPEARIAYVGRLLRSGQINSLRDHQDPFLHFVGWHLEADLQHDRTRPGGYTPEQGPVLNRLANEHGDRIRWIGQGVLGYRFYSERLPGELTWAVGYSDNRDRALWVLEMRRLGRALLEAGYPSEGPWSSTEHAWGMRTGPADPQGVVKQALAIHAEYVPLLRALGGGHGKIYGE
jgi:hypothetical protein